MEVYHWHIDSLTIFQFLENFPHVDKWETTDCTNDIIWISQDKWKHLPWSLLLFWVYLVLKRKTNVLLVTNVSYKVHSFGVNSRLKFKEQAERWSKLKIHKNNEYIYINIYIYTYISTQQIKLHRRAPWEITWKLLERIWFKIHKQWDKIWTEKFYWKR